LKNDFSAIIVYRLTEVKAATKRAFAAPTVGSASLGRRPKGATAVDHEEAFRRCYRIRRIEEILPDLKAAGSIQGSLHLCTGQEAIPVGACDRLQSQDRIVCTYRGHGWVIARGVPLEEFLAELMGRASALCGGRGGSAYLSAPAVGILGENSIVGGGVPIALGSALRSLHLPDAAVTVAVIGDGALNQGSVHESLNFASVLKLPLVVMIENNGYAELTPTDAMFTTTPLSRRGAIYDIPSVTIDGNDVDAVGSAVEDALSRARDGAGPQMLEALTHRMSGHYDLDPQTYRPEGELDRARQREPLQRLSAALPPDRAAAIRTEVDREIDAAVQRASAAPLPDPASARSHVYA
jgi:TPP-dependent pyruvate/acetoin dehydrogenase alpha subunit